MIAYTIGRLDIYQPLLNQNPPVCKLGAHGPTEEDPNGYEGGAVWFTPEAANDYLNSVKDKMNISEYGIYEIDIPSSSKDVVKKNTSGKYFNLLIDSPLIKIYR